MGALRSLQQIAAMREYSIHDLENAAVLAQKYTLTPADAVHAVLAIRTGSTIVSSDASFDRIQQLKRIDFSKI